VQPNRTISLNAVGPSELADDVRKAIPSRPHLSPRTALGVEKGNLAETGNRGEVPFVKPRRTGEGDRSQNPGHREQPAHGSLEERRVEGFPGALPLATQ
jgi:hypothetical protein